MKKKKKKKPHNKKRVAWEETSARLCVCVCVRNNAVPTMQARSVCGAFSKLFSLDVSKTEYEKNPRIRKQTDRYLRKA